MFKKILIATVLLILSHTVTAGGLVEGTTIKSVGVGDHYTNLCGYPCVVVKTEITPQLHGSDGICSYSGGWHFSINLNSTEASSIVSVVLAAEAAGGLVGIKGKGVNYCTANSGVEEIRYIYTM